MNSSAPESGKVAEMHPTGSELLQQIQAHLQQGGVVQITTNLHSTLYSQARHAGLFSVDAQDRLLVQSGRQRVRLSGATGPLVQIRFGRRA